MFKNNPDETEPEPELIGSELAFLLTIFFLAIAEAGILALWLF